MELNNKKIQRSNNKKKEGFTISSPNYATLEDIQSNLGEITLQLDKISLADGINYDTVINKINKDVTYITTTLEKIKGKSVSNSVPQPVVEPKPDLETFQTITSTLYTSQLNGCNINNKNPSQKVFLKQNEDTTITAVSDLMPLDEIVHKYKTLETIIDEPQQTQVEQNIINQITVASFSIVGLFILYRAFNNK